MSNSTYESLFTADTENNVRLSEKVAGISISQEKNIISVVVFQSYMLMATDANVFPNPHEQRKKNTR